MDDAFGMGRIERIRDLDPELQHQLKLKRTARDAVTQGHAIQKLHCNESAPFRIVNFVDGADIRMVERGSGSSLTLKTRQ